MTPPDGVPALKRTDPAQRLQDYAEALQFYLPLLGSTFESIVFAENSASDVTSLQKLVFDARAERHVEFLSFAGLDHPASYGRGYGEFKLVDYAMEHAHSLRDDAFVWKCTGRYQIKNIAKLVKRRPLVDIYCHFRNYPQRLCELFLLSFNSRGHKYAIKGMYEHLRNDIIPGVHSNEEIAFRQQVDRFPTDISIQRRFRVTPIISGTRGWDNSHYSGEWHPKIALRRTARVLTPWVWI